MWSWLVGISSALFSWSAVVLASFLLPFLPLFLPPFLPAANAARATMVVGDLVVAEGAVLESTEGLETQYGSVGTSEGLRLRSFVTRPEGSGKALPAIFVTQWVSCGSMAFPEKRDTQLRLLARQSGLVMIRIDRAGTGDSEGPGCDGLDYDTEVRHYREALDQMKAHPWVDPDRIFILGSSLGSTTAPLVAQGNSVAGVVVQGGGALTYLERMINFERLYLERSGKVELENIHSEMLRRIAFLQHYLTGKMTPQDVAQANPELSNIWASIRGTSDQAHYGRPFAWHWQAAEKDFLTTWLSLDVPVLVIYGEYDEFEMRHGHQMIVDHINRRRPGSATYLEIAKAGHDLELYPDQYDAYIWTNAARAPQLYVQPVSRWLNSMIAPGQ